MTSAHHCAVCTVTMDGVKTARTVEDMTPPLPDGEYYADHSGRIVIDAVEAARARLDSPHGLASRCPLASAEMAGGA